MLTFFGRGSSENTPSPQMQREMQLMRGYWEALRQGGKLPHRSQIDPRGFSGLLDRIFLIERVAKGQGRFRLAGMHLHDLLGMDARGMPLSTLFDPLARDRMSAALETVFEAESILTIQIEAERSIGRPALWGQMRLLPLANDMGEQKLALGCVMTEGSVGRQPRRFAIAGLNQEPITSHRLALVRSADTPDIEPVRRKPPALRLVSSRD